MPENGLGTARNAREWEEAQFRVWGRASVTVVAESLRNCLVDARSLRFLQQPEVFLFASFLRRARDNPIVVSFHHVDPLCLHLHGSGSLLLPRRLLGVQSLPLRFFPLSPCRSTPRVILRVYASQPACDLCLETHLLR